jgi:hypothetical protein
MDNDKMSYGRRRRRRGTPLIALLGAVIIIVAVTPAAALATRQEIEETIDFTDEFLDDDMQEIGPLRFTPRWSEVESVAPKRIGVFFADCRPGEFPMSGQQILQSSQLRVIESYAVAMPDDFMSWVFAIKNNDDDRRKFLAVGAICAGESGVEPREPVVSSQEVNNIINNIVIIEEEGDVVQDIDINIDRRVNQAVEIRQTVNQIAVQVNNNGGNAQLVVNQIAQQAAGDDIEQKAKVQQFLEQADPESPQFEETVQSLTRQSQQLQQQGPDANATLVLPEPEPGVMTNETSTEDLGDNATELQEQPMQPGLNATGQQNTTSPQNATTDTDVNDTDDTATTTAVPPILPEEDDDDGDNATELQQQQPMQPGLNATDADNATTAGEAERGREFSESLIENETQGASNFTEGGNFTIGGEGFENRTTTSGDGNATTAGDDDDDQTTAETTDTATDTATGNMTTGTQAGEGNQTSQEDDGRGLLDSLTEPFEDLFGGER